MKQAGKYTHLIERVPGLVKELSSMNLKQQTNMSIAANYWRLRKGKGLLSIFDQESLALWSKQITDMRRCLGSPIPLNDELIMIIRTSKISTIERMEEYRNWLEHGAEPVRYYQGYIEDQCFWAERALKLSLGWWVAENYHDLRVVPEQSIWTMDAAGRNAWRSEHRAIVGQILKDGIDWGAVYEKARYICRELDRVEDSVKKRLDQIIQKRNRYEIDSEKWKKLDKAAELIVGCDEFEYWLESENYPELYEDEIWQIRTDFDNRSSIEANITSSLGYIKEIPVLTAGHRSIYEKNMTVLEEFKRWKAGVKKDYKNKIKQDREAVAGLICDFIGQIEIPVVDYISKSDI